MARPLTLIKEGNPGIAVDIEGPSAKVHGDLDHFVTMGTNLVVNALKRGKARRIVFSSQIDPLNETVIIDVRDDGNGIAENIAMSDRLFEPGVSGGDSTGLGLALCRSVVQAMGGTIRLVNAHGESPLTGAHFQVILPLAQIPVSEPPPAAPAAPGFIATNRRKSVDAKFGSSASPRRLSPFHFDLLGNESPGRSIDLDEFLSLARVNASSFSREPLLEILEIVDAGRAISGITQQRLPQLFDLLDIERPDFRLWSRYTDGRDILDLNGPFVMRREITRDGRPAGHYQFMPEDRFERRTWVQVDWSGRAAISEAPEGSPLHPLEGRPYMYHPRLLETIQRAVETYC